MQISLIHFLKKYFCFVDQCLHDLAYKVQSQCILDFHEYAFNIKNGTVMKAIQQAK